jgi:hypothetical protein
MSTSKRRRKNFHRHLVQQHLRRRNISATRAESVGPTEPFPISGFVAVAARHRFSARETPSNAFADVDLLPANVLIGPRKAVLVSDFGIAQPLWQACNASLISYAEEPFETAASITSRIDAVIADPDLYEPGEPRPSQESIKKAKELIDSAERAGARIPAPKISVYFGEIDFTWTMKNRLLRLIVLADAARIPVLYFQTNNGEALTRGESVEVRDAAQLAQKLGWLLG